MDSSQIGIIYHRDCADGFGAAFAAHRRYPGATFIASSYDDDSPDVSGFDRIYIADFSFSRDVMLEMHKTLGIENVILLDHHETAMQKIGDLPNCHFDMNRSGAVMAWTHFYPDEEVPTLLKYVQDRDLWTWELPHSKAVSAYIWSWFTERTFDRWEKLSTEIDEEFDRVVGEGYAILRSQDQLVTMACATAHTVNISHHDVPAVQSPILQSEIGVKLLEIYPEAPFSAIYARDGKRTKWSLRSRIGGHNVGQIARGLGGGGHPAAAGFSVSD